jgi:hypothetical protein
MCDEQLDDILEAKLCSRVQQCLGIAKVAAYCEIEV